MIIAIPLKTLPCPHERLAKKMMYECKACSRYAGFNKHKGVFYCGEQGTNKGLGGPDIPQAKWDIVMSYEKGVI